MNALPGEEEGGWEGEGRAWVESAREEEREAVRWGEGAVGVEGGEACVAVGVVWAR